MRINFILPPLHMSGGIRVLAIYAEALSKKGHDVRIVAPDVTPIPFIRKFKTLIKTGKLPILIRNKPSYFDGLNLDVKTVVGRSKINNDDVRDADVVVASWWETAEWVYQLQPSKGVKVYFIQHHEVFDNLPIERCKATYRMPLKKIVIAKWLVDVMTYEYGDPNLDLVPNAVNHKQFFAPVRGKQAVPTVGFLYHTASFKGVDITLKAVKKLKLMFPALHIVAFGASDPIKEMPVPVNTKLYISPDQEFIRDIYAQCDVWITASRTEGFNLPAMEAMACRTPVVSTKAGWPAEAILDGHNGYLCEVDDVDGIVEAVAKILQLGARDWEHMSAAAYASTERASWENSADLFERALMRACGQQN